MDTVLGVSMAPTSVQMVLVEGENGDGVTVDQENFGLAGADDSAPPTTPHDQVISAILGTREGATQSGYQLTSTGVTWTDPLEATALRDALAAHKVENVMLVSAFLAAAALAQTVGSATNYEHTALLFIEPETATLAVVDSGDGSVTEVDRQSLPEDDVEAVERLKTMVSGAQELEARPEGVFVVGSGVDVARIKAELEAATTLPLSVPEEPETALARGAALASANTPLLDSSTAAMAYAQDPGTGAVAPAVMAGGSIDVPSDGREGEDDLAYSADPDEDVGGYNVGADSGAYTAVADEGDFATGAYPDFSGGAVEEQQSTRKPFLVAVSVLTIFVGGVVALVIALAISIRPHVDNRPEIGQQAVAPTKQAPPAPAKAPAPKSPPPKAPPPQAPPPNAPAPKPAPAAPAPAPAPAAPAPPPPPPAAPPPPPPPVRVPVPFGPGHGHGPGIPGVPGPHLPVPHLPGIPGL